jgi:hypothetical protein
MIKHTKLSEMQKWETAAYPVVKRVVDKHDPEALLRIGCPKDEYDPISRNITKAINREKGFGQITCISESEISNIIALSFYIDFGQWGRRIRYHKLYNEVAADLVEALRKKKLLSR